MHYVLFGLPGVGKTFVGEVFEKEFGFTLYDGDRDLSAEMRDKIQKEQSINDTERDQFFENLITSVKKSSAIKNLVVAQTFIKEKYRQQFLENFPDAQFIYIETPTEIREKRLLERKPMFFSLDYARKMSVIFELPKIQHRIITNKDEGREAVTTQIRMILQEDR